MAILDVSRHPEEIRFVLAPPKHSALADYIDKSTGLRPKTSGETSNYINKSIGLRPACGDNAGAQLGSRIIPQNFRRNFKLYQ